MRKLLKGLMVMFIAGFVISISSCDKVNEIIPLPSMEATVDNVAWVSKFRLSLLNESQSPANIVITGTPEATQDVDKAIILTVFATEAGNYSLSPSALTGDCAVAYKKTAGAADGGDDYYVSYEANISISTMDKDKQRISGTFNAKLRSTGNLLDEVIITNGTFKDLIYQIK